MAGVQRQRGRHRADRGPAARARGVPRVRAAAAGGTGGAGPVGGVHRAGRRRDDRRDGDHPQARDLVSSPSPDLRATAIRYASATGLDDALSLITAALDDPDVRVAALATTLLPAADGAADAAPAAFDALARLIPRLPAQAAAGYSLGVEEAPVTIGQAQAASVMVGFLGGRPVADLLPWLPLMDSAGRGMVASLIAGDAWWDRQAGKA